MSDVEQGGRVIALVPPTAPVPMPRRLTNAAGLIRLFYLDAATGEPLVTERWVSKHVPGKIRASYTKVLWDVEEVQKWIAKRSAA
jgi:hypothetical protein